jgi:hypothetical protein
MPQFKRVVGDDVTNASGNEAPLRRKGVRSTFRRIPRALRSRRNIEPRNLTKTRKTGKAWRPYEKMGK